MALADKKSALFWKARGMMNWGCVLALTGKPADAVQMITSGISARRSTGATLNVPFSLLYLASAYADLRQIDDAWRCIAEATTAIETTKEKWPEAELHRIAGEIALKSPEPDAPKAEGRFERALGVAREQQAKSCRCNEHGAALAGSGQGAASARTVGSGLWVVHGGVRDAGFEGGQGAVG
jgi:hypothetical protein